MKEQIRSNLAIQQFSNVESLTTRPFRPILGVGGDIFMPEPGNGEIAPDGNVGKPQRAIEKVSPIKPTPAERVPSPKEAWDKWEKDYLKEQRRPALTFEERQIKEAGIEMRRPPYIAGGVGQPPEEGRRRPEDISQEEAARRLGEAARRGREGQQQVGAAGGAEDGGNGEPPTTAEGAGEGEDGQEIKGRDLREVILSDSAEIVRLIKSGDPDVYEKIENILNRQNSNDRSYGQYLIAPAMEQLRGDRDHQYQIDYFLEYAMERIISRADVSPKSEYPRLSLEEDLNLGDILAYARIYDHSINVLTEGRERPEGAQGTIFKYLDDLRGRRHIMHELFRNMKDRRTYVQYVTQNLRKEGLAFVEKEIAGVADSQIIYEKFLGSALSFKKGWLTATDIEAVDRNVEGFMTTNAAQFIKEMKDEDGNVIGSRPLRPWELRRAAIVGKSLNAAMQRRLVYTVMGDVPVDDINTLLDSVDSEELARILAPKKLLAERFLGIDTNTRKIYIEELLKKTKESARARGLTFGYQTTDKNGNKITQGLYDKREDSWAILDTGITDPKSNSWRGTKIFLMQNEYRTETFGGQSLSIGDYLDRVKSEERIKIEERLKISNKSKRERDTIMQDTPKFADEWNNNFNYRIRDVVQRQRLFLGPLLQMGGLNTENKQIVWEKAAEFLPSRIAAFFPKETFDIVRGGYAGVGDSEELPPPPVPTEQASDELIPAPVSTEEPTSEERWNSLRNKLFLAETKRVMDDAKAIRDKKWDEVGELRGLSDYFDDVGIDETERAIIQSITELGKRKASELAKIKFPYTPFLDDVPKTDWENIDDFSYDRILVYDHSDFQEGYKEVIGLMGKPVTKPEQVIEAFVKASAKIQGPLGLKGPGGAQGVLEKDINAYLSMAQERELSKIFGPIMKLGRVPRSKMEKGNLQAKTAQNEDFRSKVLEGLAQQDVISDDPAEKDKKGLTGLAKLTSLTGLTQLERMKRENKADMKWKIYYWIRLIAVLLGPIAGAEIARTLLPREAAEQVIAGF